MFRFGRVYCFDMIFVYWVQLGVVIFGYKKSKFGNFGKGVNCVTVF